MKDSVVVAIIIYLGIMFLITNINIKYSHEEIKTLMEIEKPADVWARVDGDSVFIIKEDSTGFHYFETTVEKAKGGMFVVVDSAYNGDAKTYPHPDPRYKWKEVK